MPFVYKLSRLCHCVVISLLALVWPISTPGAMELGSYREFTLHHGDEGSLKHDVILVFHGFASAMPNGTYKKLRKIFGDRYSVVGVNYDYLDVKANMTELDVLWHDFLSDRSVTVIGTSLGGFWADYFANRHGIEKVVLVNPAVDPVADLAQFQGAQFSEKRQKHFHVSQEDI
ncbi:MAG: YqiA/YcfP family alpha/beta fold hydrolase, partial [Pseudomonadota bacterium]